MKSVAFMFFSVCMYVTHAQRIVVQGVIKDSLKHIPVSYVTIKNPSSDQTVFSDEKGLFSLSMETKGVLYLSAVGYVTDTVRYSDFKNDIIEWQLRPFVKELQGVVVSGKALDQYQYDSIARRKQFVADGGMPTMKTSGLPNQGYGYALNLDKFAGPEKRKRKSFEFFKQSEEQDYIDFHFTPKFVHKFSGLTGDTLQKFMQAHRPTYEWLRKHHSDEDLKYYINDALKVFFTRGGETENQ